jgi:hypothetical protein
MKIVIYSNCQGLIISDILRYVLRNNNINHIGNYGLIQNNGDYPIEHLYTDMFIYQPLEGHGNLDTEYIKKIIKRNNPNVVFISFPYMYFLGYFPDNDQENEKSPGDKYPYQHCKLNKLIRENSQEDFDKIILETKSSDFLNKNFILEKTKYSLDILKKKEEKCTIKVSKFIEDFYTVIKLFHSPQHPNNILLEFVTNEILKIMNIHPIKVKGPEQLGIISNSIIFPCVYNTLKLKFSDDVHYFEHLPLNYDNYMLKYIKMRKDCD